MASLRRTGRVGGKVALKFSRLFQLHGAHARFRGISIRDSLVEMRRHLEHPGRRSREADLSLFAPLNPAEFLSPVLSGNAFSKFDAACGRCARDETSARRFVALSSDPLIAIASRGRSLRFLALASAAPVDNPVSSARCPARSLAGRMTMTYEGDRSTS